MAQVVWVPQTTSRIWIAFATHTRTQSGRAPSFTLSLEDSSFPVRNRGGGGRISDRSERWRKWSGFPRPLPVSDRICDAYVDEVGTGAIRHAFPRLHKPCS